MEPEVIPFELNFRSYLFSVFSLIIMVSAIHWAIRYAQPRWPLLRKSIALWYTRDEKVRENSDELPVHEFGGRDFPPRISDVIICDEEINLLSECGTRALLRSSVKEW